MSLLDNAALQRIEASVSAVETRTAAEIAVVVVRRSDGYHDLRALYAGSLALAATAAAHWMWPLLGVARLLWLEIAVAVALWTALGWGPLLRLTIPAVRTAASVQRCAREAFLHHEVFATRARTGVLILISEQERCVAILGDSGIHAHVRDAGWQTQVDTLVRAIAQGKAADGICEVVAAIGAVLQEQVPVQPDDVNELPNAVRVERS